MSDIKPYYDHAGITIYLGDCREIMPQLEPVHAIITDPPYELGFMGKLWDNTGVANDVNTWRECLRALLPGGHLLSFGGSRTYHRMACAIEDAGFEIRDQIMWLYGSGFPKSMDVSKAIDKAAGAVRQSLGPRVRLGDTKPYPHNPTSAILSKDNADLETGYRPDHTSPSTNEARQWAGWGTALKPAHEPICVARKPPIGTVAANVLEYGAGALNIDACRIGTGEDKTNGGCTGVSALHDGGIITRTPVDFSVGRWPANVIHDGSEEVLECFPNAGGQLADVSTTAPSTRTKNCYGNMNRDGEASAEKRYTEEGSTNFSALPGQRRFDSGSAARFFYTAKASGWERGRENDHPTVKPLSLMTYLCKLLIPPSDGIILDPFVGSGTTLIAAKSLNCKAIGIELNEKYIEIAIKRLEQDVLEFTGPTE